MSKKNTFFLIVLAIIIVAFVVIRFSQGSKSVNTNTPPVNSAANIVVTSPKANEQISFPLIITGQARVFENQFNYRLKDQAGTVLASGSAYANSPDAGQFGDFSITIQSANPKDQAGTIEVYDLSAKDGSEIDLVIVPVVF